jgi:transposase InsO family protein
LSCVLIISGRKHHVLVLIDSGCSAYAFIDDRFIAKHNLTTRLLQQPRDIQMADGAQALSGQVTHFVRAGLAINDHKELHSPFLISQLSFHPIVLGIPWLQRHDPTIRWGPRTFTFDSSFCQKHCHLPSTPTTVQALQELPPRLDQEDSQTYDFQKVSLRAMTMYTKRPNTQLFSTTLEDIEDALNLEQNAEKTFQDNLDPYYHQWRKLFSKRKADQLPPHRIYDHKIPLEPGKTPPFGPLYNMSRPELEALRNWLKENLDKGFIEPSSSPAASPVLFVKKGDGLRLCIDYRGLNAITVKNRYPLPLFKETLNNLQGSKYFTKLDVVSAFNRVRIAKGQEWLTAFRTRYGLFQSKVMPFGLTGAPATFQHFINDTLREHLDVFCSAYLDDILIYSNDLATHKEHVAKVLQALEGAGLYLRYDKCEFHVHETKFLGMIITQQGVKMDPAKIETVVNWPTPCNVKDVQAYIGFANFYRRFIQGFSKILTPLTFLTRKDNPFQWTPRCQESFDGLKSAFTSAPILRSFDPSREIIVETDASDYVSAGVLSQYDDNHILHPVAFYSKKHSETECNYEIYDKELMAIIRCFEEWRSELEGSALPIKVLTDHKNLEHFMSTKTLNRRQVRWSQYLSRFDFVIQYRPGKLGGKPDALTRRSGDLPKEGDRRLQHQNQTMLRKDNLDDRILADKLTTVNLGQNGPIVQLQGRMLRSQRKHQATVTDPEDDPTSDQEPQNTEPITIANSIPEHLNPQNTEPQNTEPITVTDSTLEHQEPPNTEPPTIADRTPEPQTPRRFRTPEEIDDLFAAAYQADPFPQRIIDMIKNNVRKTKEITLADCEDRDGRLYYKKKKYVPDHNELRLQLLELWHAQPVVGHPGTSKTYEILHRHYYWPNMVQTIKRYIRNCHVCQRSKPSRQALQGTLRPLSVPHQRWLDLSMDFITKLPISSGFDAILVVVCRLSKQKVLINCNSDCNAEGLAKLFVRYVWKDHGLPLSIVSDRGTQFISRFWKHLCTRLQIKARLSTAFHPQTDGQTENANGILEQYLRSFANYQQDDWSDWTPMCEFALNQWESATTKMTPFFANKGYHPRFGFEPIPEPQDLQSLDAHRFSQKMEDINNYLRAEMLLSQESQETAANRHREPAYSYHVGDMVWLNSKNLKTRRPAKKLDWKNLGPFQVTRKISAHAFELKLPATMQVHPVFHVSLLRPAATDPLPGQHLGPPPPIVVDGFNEWEIDELLDCKIERRGRGKPSLKYLVKWSGYNDPTWEPERYIAHVKDLLRQFHQRYPDKPAPQDLRGGYALRSSPR